MFTTQRLRRWLAWGIALCVVVTASAARAESKARFLFDGTVTVGVPIAGSDYTNLFYPSPDFGLRFGAEIWLRPRIAIAPELAVDGGPLFDRNTGNVTTGRFRVAPGLRLLFGFGRGHAFFVRYLAGFEMLVYSSGGREGPGVHNFAFATEPGGGMQFRVGERTVVGFTIGFPIALHSFQSGGALNQTYSSTYVDFSAGVFLGYRR